MIETIAVAIGSALGGVARYWISVLTLSISRSLPWGTVLINVAGSFAIGLFGTLTSDGGRMPASHVTRLFFMVGVCGGFTTFSSFSLQTLDLLRAGTPWRALANVALSVLLCLAGVAAGHGVAGALDGGRLVTAQAGFTDEEA